MRRPRWAMPGRWSLARQLLVLQAAIVGLLVAAGAILAYLDSGRAADDTARQTVTALASSIADSQNVQAALATPQPSRLLQPYAERVRHDTGVDFITIMTPAGIRYTHPNPSRIGGTFVGNTAPAVAGRTFSETYTGTLGPSVRAVAPVFGEDGRVVALVSVGITIRAISAELRQRLISLAVVAAVVLAVGMAGSYLVSARLRRQTRGVAPDELRQMFDYYEAILHAVREGLLILDRTGRVVLCNDAARDLLDLTPHPANPTAPASATPAKRRATAPATKAPTNPTEGPVKKSGALRGTKTAAEPGVEPAERRDVPYGTGAAANPGGEPVERRGVVRGADSVAKGRVGGRSERVEGRTRGVVAAGDVQGRLVTELGLPEELVATLMSAEPRSDEIHVGDTRVLVVNTSPVRSRDRAMGNVVTLRDHTELQGLTGELDTVRGFAESLRSQAHEAANRLHTVVSLVELGRPEQAVEFATAELETAQRLTDRVVGSVTEPVLAALLLGKSAEAGERGVELVIAEDAVIEAVIEPRDLVTILGNLIDNAVDAAIEGAVHRPPRVVVAAREEEGELVLEVSDSGPGVDPSAVPAMFRRGWTTKSSGGPVGHGLGLALVGQAVRRHGGEVAVGAGRESGAVFTVRLPGDKR
ncbi:PAS domain-containing protein [Actinomadura madurae]|uniref:histidine kinase n=1 Tax=Actinomadura madurae TaxID=1993 RepID=A0A1I5QB25_9ACTN|nr:sensor histidine kinase [Actinomadura madurae]SFP43498.1 PAS domain-containing protein [Actinomadura madurae]